MNDLKARYRIALLRNQKYVPAPDDPSRDPIDFDTIAGMMDYVYFQAIGPFINKQAYTRVWWREVQAHDSAREAYHA